MTTAAPLALIASAMLLASGCSYLPNRWDDFKDVGDMGITVTDRLIPQFGFYFDYFQVTPIGFCYIDGKILGICNREAGYMDYMNHSWGAVFWAGERESSGVFNPRDPAQARPDQADLDSPMMYDVGIAGLIFGKDRPPLRQYYECNRMMHFGWLGIDISFRANEMADFWLGLTTFDLMGDDNDNRPFMKPVTAPAASAVSTPSTAE